MRSLFLLLVLSLVGCGSASSDSSDVKVPTTSDETKVPTTSDETQNDSKPAGPSTEPKEGPTSGPNFACRLPAPVSSEDSCVKDADCAPSVPCHARACVAVGKAIPRKPDTACTMNIDCQSADVNPCSCYEGHCALVPKSP